LPKELEGQLERGREKQAAEVKKKNTDKGRLRKVGESLVKRVGHWVVTVPTTKKKKKDATGSTGTICHKDEGPEEIGRGPKHVGNWVKKKIERIKH